MSKKKKSMMNATKQRPPDEVISKIAALGRHGANVSIRRELGSWILEGRLVEGPCIQEYRYNPASRTMYLAKIYTPEKERRKGHANAMFARLFALADDLGVTLTMNAHTLDRTTLTTDHLVAWYERLGFEVTKTYKNDTVHMERKPRTAARPAA